MKLLISLFILSQLLIAAPAFQGKRTFTQPDGTVITYHNRGDEYLHYAETEDGDILLYSKKNKRMEHVEIKEDRLKASGEAYSKNKQHQASSRSAVKRVDKKTLRFLHDLRKQKRHTHMKKSNSHQTQKNDKVIKEDKE